MTITLAPHDEQLITSLRGLLIRKYSGGPNQAIADSYAAMTDAEIVAHAIAAETARQARWLESNGDLYARRVSDEPVSHG